MSKNQKPRDSLDGMLRKSTDAYKNLPNQHLLNYRIGMALFEVGAYETAEQYFWEVIDANLDGTQQAWHYIGLIAEKLNDEGN